MRMEYSGMFYNGFFLFVFPPSAGSIKTFFFNLQFENMVGLLE